MGRVSTAGEADAARRVLVRCLERRDHTRAELASALSRRGIPAATAEAALDHFAELGLIDDAQFADRWVSSRGVAGARSPRALAMELRHRGVGAQEVAQALAGYGPQEQSATALRVAQRFAEAARRRGDDPQSARRKVLQALSRRGFPASVCSQAAALALGCDYTDPDVDGP